MAQIRNRRGSSYHAEVQPMAMGERAYDDPADGGARHDVDVGRSSHPLRRGLGQAGAEQARAGAAHGGVNLTRPSGTPLSPVQYPSQLPELTNAASGESTAPSASSASARRGRFGWRVRRARRGRGARAEPLRDARHRRLEVARHREVERAGAPGGAVFEV